VFVEVAKTPAYQDIESTGFYLSFLVRFLQVKRQDFSSASASKNVVLCSIHIRSKFNMGCRSKTIDRLILYQWHQIV